MAVMTDADGEKLSKVEKSTHRHQTGRQGTWVALFHLKTALHEPLSLNEQKGDAMNRDIIGGKWQQVRGKVKEEWGKLTDDDLKMVEGKFDKLAGLIRERYGYTKEKAEQELDRFCTTNNLYEQADAKR
jgi:uncharacterized protein YjbJ (UPF0337 family)